MNGSQDAQKGQSSHPPTHSQIFFTSPTLRMLRNRFPGTCHLPGRGPSGFPHFALRGAARLSFTARIERRASNSRYSSLREWPRLPSTARINDPSKLACLSSLGMASVVAQLRPSSEHIPIVRAPGARDHAGAVPARFIVRVLRARRAPGRFLLTLLRPHVARARGSSQLPHPLFQHPVNDHRENTSQAAHLLPPGLAGPAAQALQSLGNGTVSTAACRFPYQTH